MNPGFVIQNGHIDAKDVLAVFAQYGFKKTSMQDIAEASGVTRQTIYKKFGNKKACYNRLIKAYLSDIYTRAFAELADDERPVQFTLARVFEIVIGDSIVLSNTPYGAELLENVIKEIGTSEEDWGLRYINRIGECLARQGFAETLEDGVDKAFVMTRASRGLLIDATSKTVFATNMERIISTVLAISRKQKQAGED